MTADVTHFFKKMFFQKSYANYISFDSKLYGDKSLQQNYDLKMFGSQDRRTVMGLDELIFVDITFSTYSKNQMAMSRSISFNGLVVHRKPQANIYSIAVRISLYIVNLYIQGFVLYYLHPARNIWNRNFEIFVYFSVLIFALDTFLEIKLLFIAYY